MNTDPMPLVTVQKEKLSAQPYLDTAEERSAIPADQVLRTNLEVPSAMATVYGALPEILTYRPAAAKIGCDYDATAFDKILPYTLALSYANAQALTTAETDDGLAKRNEEAMEKRTVLFSDGTALVKRGVLPAATFEAYKGTFGYKVVATDLQILVSALRTNFGRIQGRCSVTLEELDDAERLSHHILHLVGLREQAPNGASATADERNRAFTLFIRCYDQIRRAITFLRWSDDDVDSIAPSLYPGNNKPRKPATETSSETAPAAAAQPATPAVSPNGPFMDA